MIPVKVSTFRLLILIVIINIIPGDLRTVGNSKLRKLLTEGPNYRYKLQSFTKYLRLTLVFM